MKKSGNLSAFYFSRVWGRSGKVRGAKSAVPEEIPYGFQSGERNSFVGRISEGGGVGRVMCGGPGSNRPEQGRRNSKNFGGPKKPVVGPSTPAGEVSAGFKKGPRGGEPRRLSH